MVNQMRRRFDDDVFGPGKPAYTHVIVFGGVNDLYSDLTAGRTPALIERGPHRDVRDGPQARGEGGRRDGDAVGRLHGGTSTRRGRRRRSS